MRPSNLWILSVGLLAAGCDPFARWPSAPDAFPWVFTPRADLLPYEEVRVETETWQPLVDAEQTALYVQKSVLHRPGAPAEVELHFADLRDQLPPLVPSDPTLSFVGDVMWLGDNWSQFADPVADRLDGVLRLGNLETPVSASHPTDRAELGLYDFNAPLDILDGLPLDVVQINNNHSLDVGDDGLEQTYKALTGRGFLPLGKDGNLAAAGLSDDVSVAVATYTWGVNGHTSVEHDLAIIPFGHLDAPIDLSRVADDLQLARDVGATHSVVMLHWGYEYEYWPDPHFMQLAREIIALGADVVVGHGPHVVQPAELCTVDIPVAVPGMGRCSVRSIEGRPRIAAVLYSLGNFGTTMATLQAQVGLIGSVSLDSFGVSGLGWEAVVSVDGPTVVPIESRLDDPAVLSELERLDRHLGTSWKR